MVANDNINELIQLVRNLQNTVNTLEQSVAKLDTKVQKINYLEKLLDVKFDAITFGDILQYSNDGKWHNIQPDKILTGGGVGPVITKLSDLSDVVISSPINGQSITYSQVDNKWHNNTVGSGGGGGIGPGVLDNYLTKIEARGLYFPKTGGTINGNVNIKGNLLTEGGITIHSTVI